MLVSCLVYRWSNFVCWLFWQYHQSMASQHISALIFIMYSSWQIKILTLFFVFIKPSNKLEEMKIAKYKRLISLCMFQNRFRRNDQKKGIGMENYYPFHWQFVYKQIRNWRRKKMNIYLEFGLGTLIFPSCLRHNLISKIFSRN